MIEQALEIAARMLGSDKSRGYQIEEDRQLGLRAGINGTPAFFVNGNFLNGNVPQDEFEKIIQSELAGVKGER